MKSSASGTNGKQAQLPPAVNSLTSVKVWTTLKVSSPYILRSGAILALPTCESFKNNLKFQVIIQKQWFNLNKTRFEAILG